MPLGGRGQKKLKNARYEAKERYAQFKFDGDSVTLAMTVACATQNFDKTYSLRFSFYSKLAIVI